MDLFVLAFVGISTPAVWDISRYDVFIMID